MIYLLIGEDTQAKDTKIASLKAAVLLNPEAAHFDFESLDAQHLSATNFKKSLLSLPMVSKKRLILIRHANLLKKDAIEVLRNFLSVPSEDCDIILEDLDQLKDEFKEIASQAKTFSLGIKQETSIFDMTKLMSSRKTTEALKMLNDFYDQGMYPLQMMGALIWYWGKNGRMLGSVKFEKGLKALEEADLNIKRSRFPAEYAVEKLVVELVELQK